MNVQYFLTLHFQQKEQRNIGPLFLVPSRRYGLGPTGTSYRYEVWQAGRQAGRRAGERTNMAPDEIRFQRLLPRPSSGSWQVPMADGQDATIECRIEVAGRLTLCAPIPLYISSRLAFGGGCSHSETSDCGFILLKRYYYPSQSRIYYWEYKYIYVYILFESNQ